LPKDTCSPETTEGKQGFLHPIGIAGALEKATLGFIVRDFTDAGLKEKELLLESIVKAVMKDFRARLTGSRSAAVSQHEAGDRPSSPNHRQRHGGDPPHRS